MLTKQTYKNEKIKDPQIRAELRNFRKMKNQLAYEAKPQKEIVENSLIFTQNNFSVLKNESFAMDDGDSDKENNNLCETKNNNNHRYSQHNKTQILDYTTMRNEITKKDEIILDLKKEIDEYKAQIQILLAENRSVKQNNVNYEKMQAELLLFKRLIKNQEEENKLLKNQIQKLESEIPILQPTFTEKSFVFSPKGKQKRTISSPKLSRILTVDSLLLKD